MRTRTTTLGINPPYEEAGWQGAMMIEGGGEGGGGQD